MERVSQGHGEDPWFRPEMPGAVYAELVANFPVAFRAEVAAIEEPLANLTTRGLDAAEVYAEKLISPGPFVVFLRRWYAERGETAEQRELRLTANYIRHHLTSYDDVLREVTGKWWAPDAFFDAAWDAVMSEISRKFPELTDTQRAGRAAKDAYKKHREASRYERNRKVQNQVEQMWDRGMSNGPSWA